MEIVVDILNESQNLNIDSEDISIFVKSVLKDQLVNRKDKTIYLSLLLTDDDSIQEINKKYRNKDMPTDVISFAYNETENAESEIEVIGDIVISMDKISEQAKENLNSFEREFYYILTHGILHLIGYNHEDESDKKIMREKEEEILLNFQR